MLNNKSKPIHVFINHSSITNVTTNAIIKELKLDYDEILILSMRNYYANLRYESIHFDGFKVKSIFNVFSNRKKLKCFDDNILSITRYRKYHLYIPHQLDGNFLLLSSHYNCVQFNYIEEGLASYIEYSVSKKVYKTSYRTKLHELILPLLIKMTYGKRLPNINIYNCEDLKYGQAFGLFKESFPGFKNRKMVRPDYGYIDLCQKGFSHLLIFGAEVENKYVKQDEYNDLFICFLKLFEDYFGNEPLHYKWHPSQSESFKSQISNIFSKSNVNVEELRLNISLELIAFHYDVNFYMLVSSSGFYAAMLGRKVYSFFRMLETSEQLNKKMAELPKLYYQIIKHPKDIDELRSFWN